MGADERIRHLCERVVKAKGEEFQAALLELQEAIETRFGADQQDESEAVEQ